MGELTKLSNAGKMSPGPIYHYEDANKYHKVNLDSNYLLSHLVGALEVQRGT